MQEILNLTWRDADAVDRTILIRKRKTDYLEATPGRTIVLPLTAMTMLAVRAHARLQDGSDAKLDDRLINMTPGAFKQCWADLTKRAKTDDLHFHDLRRVAGSRFHRAGLTKPENDLMLGHAKRDIRSTYVEPNDLDLKIIRDSWTGQFILAARPMTK